MKLGKHAGRCIAPCFEGRGENKRPKTPVLLCYAKANNRKKNSTEQKHEECFREDEMRNRKKRSSWRLC